MPAMTTTPAPARHPRGFTMVELLTVIAILGTLMAAVAVGVTAGADRQREAQAEQALRAVMLAQLDVAASHGQFTPDPAQLGMDAPPTVVVGPAAGAQTVSIAAGDDSSVAFAAATDHGACVYARLLSPHTPGDATVWVDDTVCDATLALPTGAAPRSAAGN